MKRCIAWGLLALTACSSGREAYLLECRGTQDFEWDQTRAVGFMTLYFRIDQERRAIYGQSPSGQFDNVCRASCAQLQFGKDAIVWTDTTSDEEGADTRIVSRLDRTSGELHIRTVSQRTDITGPHETLHGDGLFHCREMTSAP
ncbi:hypothetical protein [Novosphingobium sp. BW1]|uniref:hypothetical protein n=1 Tax=Novosphingobium sp. BW1 TaxID=2592621 RepID=UPI0011DE73A6|nr:hypothetical protein [Novosphingobium sp. BW1]TYC86241.1 hypothetical protein FMM79_14940 [Novosphingobium sp. BW1]